MYVNKLLSVAIVILFFASLLNGEDVPTTTASYNMSFVAGINSSIHLETPTPSVVPLSGIILFSTPAAVTASTAVLSSADTSKWNVTDVNGHVCILFQSAIRMKFQYLVQGTNETKENFTYVPLDAVVDGSCGSIIQTISLIFYKNWNLTFTFTRNDTEYFMSKSALSYNLQHGYQPFPEAITLNNSSVYFIDDDGNFKTEVGKSGVCTSESVALINSDPLSIGLQHIDLYDTRVEAFRGNVTNADFSTMGYRCSNDEISILVPIIVGACLAGLIVLVLIAYFIGRHRSKRGYLNV